MNEMTLQELFEVGISFESSIGEGTKSERARIPKNYSRLSLTEEMISTLVGFDKEINFLVAGEIWCPDFQLNTTVLKKFTELNSNFNISVITMGRGKKYLSTILDRDKDTLKFPLILVLDKDFHIIGTFEERPNIIKAVENFDDIKLDYYKGKYLLDTASDFINIINKYK